MPDTNPTPVDLDALEQLTDKATSGPWELHCHGHIESGCRCMSCYACTGWTLRHMPSCDDVAALWDEAERGQPEPGVSCDSDVFIYDDARFIAAAREAIPALIAEVRELRSARAARPAEPCEVVIEPGSPVTEQDIEAARAWTWPYAMPTDPEVRERLDRQLRAAIPGPDSERIHELEAENERLRENWADLADRTDKASDELREIEEKHRGSTYGDWAFAKAHCVELVRDYMRSYR